VVAAAWIILLRVAVGLAGGEVRNVIGGTLGARPTTWRNRVQPAAVPCLRRRVSVSSSVEEKVIGIVSEQLNVPKEDIKSESKFVDDLKADSLDVVELVMEFEEEFEITIPDEDYEKIRTVGDATKYITEKQGG
jgi:acyl carrier protein